MSSLATARTARQITTAIKAATPGLRWETTSQGPYSFRVVLRGRTVDGFGGALGAAGLAVTAVQAMEGGSRFTATWGHDRRGTVVVNVTDETTREQSIRDMERTREETLARELGYASVEAYRAAPGRAAVHADPELSGEVRQTETGARYFTAEEVRAERAAEAATEEAAPVAGLSDRIATRLAAVRYVKALGTGSARWTIRDRDTDELVGSIERTTPPHVALNPRFQAADRHGLVRVHAAASRADAAMRLIEWLEKAADAQRAEGERHAALMQHRTAARLASAAATADHYEGMAALAARRAAEAAWEEEAHAAGFADGDSYAEHLVEGLDLTPPEPSNASLWV